MINKNNACVIKCIKANRNRFGFGHTHKVGQYIMPNGKGSDNINVAAVYGRDLECPECDYEDFDIPFEDFDTDEWKNYYVVVPVEIILKIV